MGLFEWIRDIQMVYDDLISNAKDINLKEIETFRDDQDKKFEEFTTKMNVLVNTALGNLTVDIDIQTNDFDKKLNSALKNIEKKFQKNIKNLEKLIIEKVGTDF